MQLGEVVKWRPIVVAEDVKRVQARIGGDLSRWCVSNSQYVSGLDINGLV